MPPLHDGLGVLPSSFAHSPSSHTHRDALWGGFSGFSAGGSCYRLSQTATKSQMSLREQETRLRRTEGPIQEAATSKARSLTTAHTEHTLAGVGKPSEAKAGGSTGAPSHHSNLLGSL